MAGNEQSEPVKTWLRQSAELRTLFDRGVEQQLESDQKLVSAHWSPDQNRSDELMKQSDRILSDYATVTKPAIGKLAATMGFDSEAIFDAIRKEFNDARAEAERSSRSRG